MGIFSRRVRPSPPLTSVTAAAKQIAPTTEQRSEAHLKRVEGWQTRAWDLYDELGYTAVEALAAQDALERLRSPLGGRREIQRAFGVHLFVPGECYLVGEPDPPGYPNLDERWDVSSVDEVKISQTPDGDRVVLTEPGRTGNQGRVLPLDTFACRIWQRHPRFSRSEERR